MRVLFVCTGNLCRSPFAERALRREVRGRWPGWVAASAGTWAVPGTAPPPDVVEAASDFGVDLAAHRARLLDVALVAEGDLLVGMEEAHLVELRKAVRTSGASGRILALGSLDAGPASIPDPYDASPEEIRRVFRRIAGCVGRLVATFAGGRGP